MGIFSMLFIFLGILLSSVKADVPILNCYNYTLNNFSAGDFTIFQSDQYPEDPHTQLFCGNRFYQSDENLGIWFVFLNGAINNFDLAGIAKDGSDYEAKKIGWDEVPEWFSYFTTWPLLEFNVRTFTISSQLPWQGFQAFVYVPKSSNESCPLNGLVYNLTSEADIIPIASTFIYPYLNGNTSYTCTWTFTVAPGYKLKIHIRDRQFSLFESLKVTIDDKTTVELTNTTVQYFHGSTFIIQYTRALMYSIGGYGFGGIVTAVKANPIINTNCNLTNFNRMTGYFNNELCSMSFPINNNQTYYINYQGYLEKNVDTVTLTSSSLSQTMVNDQGLIIDDAAENLKIKFQSDGSLTQGGIEVKFTEAICECNTIRIISCAKYDVQWYSLMKNASNSEYCSNMKCHFKIQINETCASSQITLLPNFILRKKTSDYVKIFNNNTLLYTITATNPLQNHLILPSFSQLSFEFESDDSVFGISEAPMASFGILVQNLNVQSVMLSETNFTYTLNIAKFSGAKMLTVSVPDKYTLDLFVAENAEDYHRATENYRYRLYDSKTLNNYVSDFTNLKQNPVFNNLRQYTSKSGSLTLLATNYYYLGPRSTAFFRIREIHSKDCISPNNDPSPNNVIPVSNMTAMAKASSTGPCIFTVLYWDYYAAINDSKASNYLRLRTDANKDVKYVTGVTDDYTFFTFNNETASSWNDLFFFGLANSFIIPPGSSLSFIATWDLWRNYQAPYKKGIITSSTFVNPMAEISSSGYAYIPEYSQCRVTITFLDISDNANLTISHSRNQSTRITQLGQVLYITTANETNVLKTNLYEPEIGQHRGYVMEFEVYPSSGGWNFGIASIGGLLLLFRIF